MSSFNASATKPFEFASKYAFMHAPQAPVVELRPQESLVASMSDGVLALAAPVVAYWLLSAYFYTIDTLELCEQYRIHPAEEIAKRNKATRLHVLREVILQHVIQTAVGLAVLQFDDHPVTGFELNAMWHWRQYAPADFVPDFALYYAYMYGISFCKIAVGFVIIDTWQYWLHRLMHANSTLYRWFHSVHHELYVPYAFGALFNNPVEGFLLDTLGTGLAMLITGLTHREQIVFYTFATMKTVDDHCGYALPWDLFRFVFPNNAVYHDIHHQMFGLKSNFAQPFFTFWDELTGTKFHGFEEYEKQQRRVTIDKYREFLQRREEEKQEKVKNLSARLRNDTKKSK